MLAAIDEEGEEEEIEEGAKPKMIMLPTMPSAREVEEHSMTHCPYRAWCEECVMGAGISAGHRGDGGVGEVPVVSVDYMFLNERESEEKGDPILVGHDNKSGTFFAHVVKEKGANTYAIKRLVGEIRRLGYPKIILKSDQVPSIRALKEAVMEMKKKWKKEGKRRRSCCQQCHRKRRLRSTG